MSVEGVALPRLVLGSDATPSVLYAVVPFFNSLVESGSYLHFDGVDVVVPSYASIIVSTVVRKVIDEVHQIYAVRLKVNIRTIEFERPQNRFFVKFILLDYLKATDAHAIVYLDTDHLFLHHTHKSWPLCFQPGYVWMGRGRGISETKFPLHFHYQSSLLQGMRHEMLQGLRFWVRCCRENVHTIPSRYIEEICLANSLLKSHYHILSTPPGVQQNLEEDNLKGVPYCVHYGGETRKTRSLKMYCAEVFGNVDSSSVSDLFNAYLAFKEKFAVVSGLAHEVL